MIYTFYSYKGGVGRSMAMANVAEWLYRQGLRVVMVDWDLEAPGLESYFFPPGKESYFFPPGKELDAVRSQLGLIDMLTAYKRMFPRLSLPPRAAGVASNNNLGGPATPAQALASAGAQLAVALQPAAGLKTEESQGLAERSDDRLAATLQVLEDSLPPISSVLYPIHPPVTEHGPALWLLPAGWRSDAQEGQPRGTDKRFAAYAQAVQDFNWTDFYLSYEGEAYFEWLRRQLTAPALADVVLIDSRTGVTEMGGVCTRQLSDVVVSFCAPNLQNQSGVEMMAKSFRRTEVIAQRRRKIEIVMVPTRIDVSELDAQNNFEKEFRTRLDQFTPAAFGTVKSSFWNLAIRYIPKYAYTETLAVTSADPTSGLPEAYQKLAAHLVLLAEGESGARIRRKYAHELQRVFGPLLPSVVIAHDRRAYQSSAGQMVASELRTRLSDYGVTAWPELPAGLSPQEEWRQITGLIDQSKCLVLAVAPGEPISTELLRQWRYARQQGLATFMVAPGGAAGIAGDAGYPRWLRETYCYDLNRDWDALARLLQSPPQMARVPFMAPDLPANYVPRQQEELRLKELLLSNDDAGGRSANFGLWGSAGCGKRVLAMALCHDEAVITHFCDGILWAKLGIQPDIAGELAKLYTALTGERVTFADEREAGERLAERLAEKKCLLVLDDVWELKHLKPCLDAAPRSRRLIITRDLNILTSVGAEAILVGDFNDAEAVELLTAQLNLLPEDAARFTPYVARIGRWPLALKLANAALRKRLGPGVRVGDVLDYLDQALNKDGVLAFDQSDAPDKDESIARSIGLTLDQLSEVERERYAQLAFFPPHETITSARLAERWRLDVFETERLLHRFAELALVRFDLSTKTVEIHSYLRDYILNPASGYDYNSRYEVAFKQLPSEMQEMARRVFTRLVRLALPNEKAGDTLLTIKLSEFDEDHRRIIPELAEARLVTLDREKETVQLPGDEMLRNWARLQNWLQADREFLLWRQLLRRQVAEWYEHQDPGALLSGARLSKAMEYQANHRLDLTRAELAYIEESARAAEERERLVKEAQEKTEAASKQVQITEAKHRRRQIGAVAVIILLLALGVISIGGFFLWQSGRNSAQLQASQAILTGNERTGQGDYDGAISSYSKAITLTPNNDLAYASRGSIYYLTGDYERAITDYGEALKINEANPTANYYRGSAYALQGDADEALKYLDRAIELKPNYPEAYSARGYAYLLKADKQANQQHWLDRAISDLDKAVSLSPNDANAYANRGRAYLLKAMYDKAITDLTKALQLRTDFAEAYLYRGIAYAKSGDKLSAVEDLGKVTGFTKDAALRGKAASQLAQLGVNTPAVVKKMPKDIKIFLQYAGTDTFAINRVQDLLSRVGYNVQSPQPVQAPITDADVRYFDETDKASAQDIVQEVSKGLKGAGFSREVKLKFLDNPKYASVPIGNIEVWLPPLERPPLPKSAQDYIQLPSQQKRSAIKK